MTYIHKFKTWKIVEEVKKKLTKNSEMSERFPHLGLLFEQLWKCCPYYRPVSSEYNPIE